MKNNKELLNSILTTTQMGQVGIRSVLDNAMNPELRKALRSQLQEYDTIEREATSIASSRGWELEELDPAVRGMANMMSKMKLLYGGNDSKIAAMMIQGNTRGMIIGFKDQHQTPNPDSRVGTLSQKLLDCEEANIRQMQGFL